MELLFRIKNNTPEAEAVISDTDFKAHYDAINANVSWYSMKTSIRKVTRDYVIPYIGQELYDELASRFNDAEIIGDPDEGIVIGDPVTGIVIGTGAFSDIEIELLDLLRDAIAEYAVWHAASFRIITFGDAGLRVNLDGGDMANSRPPQAWELKHYFFKVMLEADKHLDAVLAYLDKNQADFETYALDKYNLPPARLWIRTAAEFDAIAPIAGSRRTFLRFWPAMEKAGRREILPVLGETLYTSLLEDYQEQVTDNEALEALLPYVQRVVAHYAMWQSLPRLTCIIEDEGVRSITSSDGMNTKQLAHEERLSALMRQAENDYREAKEALVTFLYKNTATYPAWKEGEVYLDSERTDGQGLPYSFGDGGVFLT